jgi:hypothetical protein
LRKFSGSIYTWLTQLALDPTNSGRVTMDNLMTLVTTALEWSYEAKATDVLAEMLEKAATLLVLHRDTLKLIDGAGPSTEVPQPPSTEQGNGSKMEPETVPVNHESHATETVITVEEQAQTAKTLKCTFPGVVSIELKRFQASPTQLVECPNCGRTRTLTPLKGMLRFPSHDKRKMTTPNTGRRWVKGKTDWDIVGSEKRMASTQSGVQKS